MLCGCAVGSFSNKPLSPKQMQGPQYAMRLVHLAMMLSTSNGFDVRCGQDSWHSGLAGTGWHYAWTCAECPITPSGGWYGKAWCRGGKVGGVQMDCTWDYATQFCVPQSSMPSPSPPPPPPLPPLLSPPAPPCTVAMLKQRPAGDKSWPVKCSDTTLGTSDTELDLSGAHLSYGDFEDAIHSTRRVLSNWTGPALPTPT